MTEKSERSRSGDARAQALSPERRAEIARKAATARWDKDLPVAEFEGDFAIGDTGIACAVLPNNTRIITQAAFLRALGARGRRRQALESRPPSTSCPSFCSPTR